jgi:hypothetical protein
MSAAAQLLTAHLAVNSNVQWEYPSSSLQPLSRAVRRGQAHHDTRPNVVPSHNTAAYPTGQLSSVYKVSTPDP